MLDEIGADEEMPGKIENERKFFRHVTLIS